MRLRHRFLALWLALATSSAQASGATWPIFTEVKYPAHAGPEGGRATVSISVGRDATDVRVEIYGLDGMTVDPGNKKVITLAALKPGASTTVEVTFHPPDGRSSIAVNASARFGKTQGNSVRDFPWGAENAAQRKEHSRCVRQDPDGTWIRLMGCDDEAASDAGAAAPAKAGLAPSSPLVPGTVPPPLIDLASLRSRSTPQALVRVEGYVLDSYFCPPCPKGAQCKPCMTESCLFIGSRDVPRTFDRQDPPPEVAVIAVDEPSKYEQGLRASFELRLRGQHARGGPDATLVNFTPLGR